MTTTTGFGTLPDGRAVTAYELRTEGGLELTLLDFGATVQSLRVPSSDGQTVGIALGYPDLSAYRSPGGGYFGATVGRYANRISEGRFSLDGRQYELTTNEGTTCVHGGAEGFSHRLWSVVDSREDSVTLELVSPDGDQGFPGRLTARATYSVAPGEVSIELSATSDAATVVSLTNHAYFNLMGAGRGSVDEHLLTIEADTYLPVDERSIPLGRFDPVTQTPFDFTSPAAIGPRVREAHAQIQHVTGIDHAYHLRGSGMRRAARLDHPASGRFLEVHTDLPSLQVYTGNRLDGTATALGGRLLRQGDGIALETQRHPDAPNQEVFPTPVLRPGEVYRAETRWMVGGF